ncbi:MAG: stage III sporulation protein AD [Clostridia bacterium]|nr:stage III sporulation protein AD [Clostridia bacterium]
MDFTAIIGIGIVGALLAVTVKSYRPELSLCISLATGVVIFLASADGLGTVISEMNELFKTSGVDTAFFKVAMKVIAIAYVTEFAAEAAKDSGEGAIAKKLEFAGKTAVLVVMMPVMKNLTQVIMNTLMSF